VRALVASASRHLSVTVAGSPDIGMVLALGGGLRLFAWLVIVAEGLPNRRQRSRHGLTLAAASPTI
jgi:hypothetical protein